MISWLRTSSAIPSVARSWLMSPAFGGASGATSPKSSSVSPFPSHGLTDHWISVNGSTRSGTDAEAEVEAEVLVSAALATAGSASAAEAEAEAESLLLPLLLLLPSAAAVAVAVSASACCFCERWVGLAGHA